MYGSRLGADQRIILRTDSTAKHRAPVGSNLEKLLTHPKKIFSKSGVLLGYDGLKYPLSKFEEALELQREMLKTASIRSPSQRKSVRGSQLSSEFASQRGSVVPGEKTEPGEAIPHVEVLFDATDGSPKMSREMSQIIGWEGQLPQSDGLSGPLSSLVQSTRVGGATFVRKEMRSDTEDQQETVLMNTHQTQASSTAQPQPKKRTQLARYVSKEEKLKRKYNGAAKLKAAGERNATTEMGQYQPLQLGNLNVLLD